MRTGTEISKKPRGRPRAFVAAEVLDRVRVVFLEKGFAAASVDELAAATPRTENQKRKAQVMNR